MQDRKKAPLGPSLALNLPQWNAGFLEKSGKPRAHSPRFDGFKVCRFPAVMTDCRCVPNRQIGDDREGAERRRHQSLRSPELVAVVGALLASKCPCSLPTVL